MSELQTQVAEAGAKFRQALDQVEAQVDELFADRQESSSNFVAILTRIREQSEWLERRIARLLEKPEATTEVPEATTEVEE